MKKLLYVVAIVVLGTVFSSCEQDEVAPSEYELVDPELTEGEGDEDEGDRPTSSNAS